ncbi:MAG: hypothetical protein U0531_13350 [Dehalococcoidia bacterium]
MLGDRYVAEQLIAHGGAATVYAGHDDVLDRRVAIKLLRVEGAGAARGFPARGPRRRRA